MTRIVFALVGTIMATTALHAQSLADVARKTEEEQVKSADTKKAGKPSATKVYTNEDLRSTSWDGGPFGNGGGIQPLTQGTFEAARAAAASLDTGLNSPVMIRLRSAAFPPGTAPTREELQVRQEIIRETTVDRPFSFHIMTPYTVVVDIVKSAARKFTDPQFPSLKQLNAGLVNIVVGPGDSMTTVDVIENVVIKRGGQVLNPLKATVTPTVVQNALGVEKESAEGVFQFDYSTFVPDTAITIVMVGRAGNFEWTMPPEELSRLR